MKILCIGDLHIQKKNLLVFKKFEMKLLEYIQRNLNNIDIIVLLGDILHTMDIINTFCLNTALEFFKKLKQFDKPIYVIVGNHDYIGPNEILSKNHWMNNICFHNCVQIVDSIVKFDEFVFLPYVPPGKFNAILSSTNLKDTKYIFCHQEFKNAEFEFSVIKSEKGDVWDENNPMVISGHIHQKQWLQKNIYYTGTPYQTRFNENEDKTIALLDTITGNIKEITLKLPKLITIEINIADVEKLLKYNFIPENLYKIIITSPSLVLTQTLVKNQIYKKLKLYSNLTILFKYTKEVIQRKTHNIKHTNFKDILYENIKHSQTMVQIYKELI